MRNVIKDESLARRTFVRGYSGGHEILLKTNHWSLWYIENVIKDDSLQWWRENVIKDESLERWVQKAIKELTSQWLSG